VPFLLLLLSISFAADAKRLGTGSREFAKGNAAVADTSAFSAAYWNPGMLAFKRELAIALHAENRNSNQSGGSFGIEGGTGNRMGMGMAIIFKRDSDILFTDENGNEKAHATPLFILGYTGLGYRAGKKDGLGVSLSIMHESLDFSQNIGLVDEFQSPLSFDFGWFRFWNAKWQSGLQIRNLGLNSKLSASWRKNPSRDNSWPSSTTFRPKIFEAGATHRNLLMGKPASASLSLLSYQEADTLFVFDPDWHIFKGRFGFEWRVIESGDLRFGIDGKEPSIGLGYGFNIADKILWADYAFPMSLTLRMKF